MNIYLAGQISGLTKEEAFGWRDCLKDKLEYLPNVRVLVPERADFVGGSGDGDASYLQEIDRQRGEEAAQKDFNAICCSNIVLFNLLYTRKISIGTLIEMGWAFTLGKYVLVVLQPGTVYDHSFVHWCASQIVDNLDEALRVTYERVGIGYA